MSFQSDLHPYYTSLPAQRPLLIAHRGGGGLWPQNTLYAFERAAQLGANVFETDIHLTADGAVVVMHDDEVDRLTDGTGPIATHTLAELKALDAGYRWTNDGGQTYPYRGMGIQIPTLDELFAAFPQMHFNIDMKDKNPELVRAFVQIIRQRHMEEKVLGASFHHDNLTLFRSLLPQAGTVASQQETLQFLLLHFVGLGGLLKSSALTFQPPEKQGALTILTPRFVKAVHRTGRRVDVWTVDEEADLLRMMALGLDGIITDRPDNLRKLILQI